MMSEPPRPRLALPTEEEVCAYRDRGLHPVVLWLPALGSEQFSEETRRQTKVLLSADEQERDVMDWIDSVGDDALSDPKQA